MAINTLKFQKYTYGPYAPALRHVLTKMDGAYLKGVGDGTKPSEIIVLDAALNDAERYFSAAGDPTTNERVQRIAKLIDGFESPYGMELLGTVHWAAGESESKSLDEVIQRVHAWNARKRELMKPAHIKVAYERLMSEGWIN
ncbi:hypothetical protein [Shinella sp. M31]|uniref:hypothetical protein n=1 Tax=Shinella sp. M31 TaxID=3368615 RepID=UPI003BA15A1D